MAVWEVELLFHAQNLTQKLTDPIKKISGKANQRNAKKLRIRMPPH
jgi:hypothetical protein